MRFAPLLALSVATVTIGALATPAEAQRRVYRGDQTERITIIDENGRARTRITVRPRSFLDGSTEVVPGVPQRPVQLLHQVGRLQVVEVHLPVAGHERHPAAAPVAPGAAHGASSAVSPGSAAPSRYSRLAPPPVEMWVNASSGKPSSRTAAAESIHDVRAQC